MEWFAIALTGFLALLSPVNFVGDRLVADQIRQRLYGVEELSVRIDNAPNFQLVQGKVQRVRIAGQGVELLPQVRVERVQLEMDPIDVQWQELRQAGGGNLTSLRQALRQPLQGAAEIVVTEAALNQALQDPQIKARLQALLDRFLPPDIPRLQLRELEINFLENERLALRLLLAQQMEPGAEPEVLDINLETGIAIDNGDRLQLLEPSAELNGRRISSLVLDSIINSVLDVATLTVLERWGVTTRIIRYDLTPEQARISAFVSISPSRED